MKNIKRLLDEVKKAKGIESDYALAKALDINKARISAYYAGKEAPNEIACLRIAKAINRPFDEIMAAIRIDAEKDEKRREEWRRYYKSIGGYAASFMLLLFASVKFFVTSPENAYADQALNKPQCHSIQIMRLLGQISKRICAKWKRNLCSAFRLPGLAM